jgi:PAS domain S-box-containing protein/putative nucleotidyltransferase with HDIG domain
MTPALDELASACPPLTEIPKIAGVPRESYEFFQLITENCSDIISILEADGHIRYESPSVERVLGFKPEERVGTHIAAHVHPEDLALARESLEKSARAPESLLTFEVRVRHKEGTWRTLEIVGANLLDEPRVHGMVGTARDVTGRRQAETALRESEERYRNLVELSPETIAVHSDGKVVYINPAGARLFGADAAEALLGRLVLDFVHPDFREAVAAGDRWSQDHKRPTALVELKLLRLDGEAFLAEVRGIPVTYLGEPATQIVIHDITERRRAEAEIRRLYESAERRLRRTQALRIIDIAIGSSFDLRTTLAILLEQVVSQLGVDAADVLLLKTPSRTLEYAAGRGFRSQAIQETCRRVGEGYAGRAVLERRTVFIPDLSQVSSSFARQDLLGAEGFQLYYGVPLLAKGQVKGILEVFHRTPLETDREWLDFLEALAVQAALAIDGGLLFEELQRSNSELFLAYETTLEGWTAALDLRDKETEGHTQRVTEMTLRLARAMGFDEEALVHVRRGALLHDIGKMGIPDAILLKPGQLDEEEWEIMRRHPTYAYELLSPIAYLRPALDIPYCHHEKWDGTGYPRGLQGDQIPLAARLFAVVDVWDALRSDRPYRKGWPAGEVLEHIRSLSGTHLDPAVVEAFLRLMGMD